MSTCLKISINAALERIGPGDPVIFCGRGVISAVSKTFGLSRVSHVGTVYDRHTLCETTNAEGKSYALKRDLRKVIADYDGEVYLLPLASRYRNLQGVRQSRETILLNWLDKIARDKVPYDYWQALRCVIVTPWQAKESFRQLYCVEITLHALEIMCLVNMNCSEGRPKNVHRLQLYSDIYYCVKGSGKPLKGYNSVAAEGFGYSKRRQGTA